MRLFQSHWDPTAEYYRWVMPDSFTVRVPVIATVSKKIEVDEFNHKTFTYMTSVLQPQKRGRSLAANITHSVDSWVMREMVRRANAQGFELIAVHDNFVCHPNYMGLVRQNYREVLAELADMDLVNNILGQLTGQYPGYNKKSQDLSKHIVQSEYALS